MFFLNVIIIEVPKIAISFKTRMLVYMLPGGVKEKCPGFTPTLNESMEVPEGV